MYNSIVLKNNVPSLNTLLLNNANPSSDPSAHRSSNKDHWSHRSLTNIVMKKCEIFRELPKCDI